MGWRELLDLLVITLFQLEGEEECSTFLVFWYEVNLTMELGHDEFAYDQAKSDSFKVDFLLFVLDRAKQLEQFALVFLLNAKPRVDDIDKNEVS